ncbi:DUF6879 family protein [Streptantibioticus silvisoli]|uniref:DUF6879 family protein n=1 Tax=Streptantibioticus silvisoli TaxID=2705255 RepID=UPI003F6B74F5
MPDVSTGDRSRGLLSYLFGPGRRNEHTDPHIVAAFAMPGIIDPGRVPLDEHEAALTDLAQYLDQPVKLRGQRTGKPVPQHVWHCPVRTAPGDRYLTDVEWEHATTPLNVEAGEQIRWLPRCRLPEGLAFPFGGRDWWLIDDRLLAAGHIDSEGRVLGHEVIEDRETVANATILRDHLWSVAAPHHEYQP